MSVEHTIAKSYTNAMTAWVETNDKMMAGGIGNQIRVCTRELQNFDGIHKGIKIVSY